MRQVLSTKEFERKYPGLVTYQFDGEPVKWNVTTDDIDGFWAFDHTSNEWVEIFRPPGG